MSSSDLTGMPVLSSRKHPRTACKIPATIIISPELPPIKCTVIDISPGGAGILLWVGSTFGIPEKFLLHIQDEKDRRPCRVAWIQAHTLGVEFVKPNY